MFGSNWRSRTSTLILAFVVLVAVLAASGVLVSNKWIEIHDTNAAYQKNAENDRKKSAHEIAQACHDLAFIQFRICVASKMEAYYRDQATNEDLQAQQDMAFWAFWILIATTISIAISLVGIILLVRNLKLGIAANNSAQKAIKVSKDIGEAQVRAYVDITAAHITLEATELIQWIDIVPFNSGNSPAANFRWNVEIMIIARGFCKRQICIKNIDESAVNRAAANIPAQARLYSPLSLCLINPFAKQVRDNFEAFGGSFIAHLKITFSYEDVFEIDHSGQTYFTFTTSDINDLSKIGRFELLPIGRISTWDVPETE